ncbi:uncharacterized protein [Ambystoma mexicanum]|uniref:uncharacterized protein isoform X2 n=1 Tax=Ambystoma mexicanum TaxID=8296 RepID=UPI0037E8C2EB
MYTATMSTETISREQCVYSKASRVHYEGDDDINATMSNTSLAGLVSTELSPKCNSLVFLYQQGLMLNSSTFVTCMISEGKLPMRTQAQSLATFIEVRVCFLCEGEHAADLPYTTFLEELNQSFTCQSLLIVLCFSGIASWELYLIDNARMGLIGERGNEFTMDKLETAQILKKVLVHTLKKIVNAIVCCLYFVSDSPYFAIETANKPFFSCSKEMVPFENIKQICSLVPPLLTSVRAEEIIHCMAGKRESFAFFKESFFDKAQHCDSKPPSKINGVEQHNMTTNEILNDSAVVTLTSEMPSPGQNVELEKVDIRTKTHLYEHTTLNFLVDILKTMLQSAANVHDVSLYTSIYPSQGKSVLYGWKTDMLCELYSKNILKVPKQGYSEAEMDLGDKQREHHSPSRGPPGALPNHYKKIFLSQSLKTAYQVEPASKMPLDSQNKRSQDASSNHIYSSTKHEISPNKSFCGKPQHNKLKAQLKKWACINKTGLKIEKGFLDENNVIPIKKYTCPFTKAADLLFADTLANEMTDGGCHVYFSNISSNWEENYTLTSEASFDKLTIIGGKGRCCFSKIFILGTAKSTNNRLWIQAELCPVDNDLPRVGLFAGYCMSEKGTINGQTISKQIYQNTSTKNAIEQGKYITALSFKEQYSVLSLTSGRQSSRRLAEISQWIIDMNLMETYLMQVQCISHSGHNCAENKDFLSKSKFHSDPNNISSTIAIDIKNLKLYASIFTSAVAKVSNTNICKPMLSNLTSKVSDVKRNNNEPPTSAEQPDSAANEHFTPVGSRPGTHASYLERNEKEMHPAINEKEEIDACQCSQLIPTSRHILHEDLNILIDTWIHSSEVWQWVIFSEASLQLHNTIVHALFYNIVGYWTTLQDPAQIQMLPKSGVQGVSGSGSHAKKTVLQASFLSGTMYLEHLINKKLLACTFHCFITITTLLVYQLTLKVVNCISNIILNKNNSNMKQFLHVQVDIDQVVESVYSNILQEYETVQAMQAALASSNRTVIDRLAKEMTHHLQALLPGEILPESCAPSADNIVDEVLGNVLVPDTCPPHDAQTKESSLTAVYAALFLEDIIADLLSQIILASNITDDICEKKSEFEIMEMIVELVHLLLGELRESEVKVVSVNKETMDLLQQNMTHVNRVVDSVYCDVFQQFGSHKAVKKFIKTNRTMLAEKINGLLLSAMLKYQIQPCLLIERSPFQYTTLNPSIILQKAQINVKNAKHKRRYLIPRKTVLSSKVLEDIISRLISKIFPSSCNKVSFSDSEFKRIISKLVTDVMIQISQHEIWDMPNTKDIKDANSQKDVPGVVDVVYNNVLHKYGSPQAIQDMVTYRSQSLVKSVSRFVVREISNPNFVAVSSGEGFPRTYSSLSVSHEVDRVICGLHVSQSEREEAVHRCVYSSFLQEIISGIILKMFTFSDQITQEPKAKKPETELNKEVSTLVHSVLMEIRNSQIRVNYLDVNKPILDSIVNTMFKKIFWEHETNVAVFTSLASNSSLFAEKIVCLIKEAIADYQLERLVTEDVSLCSYTTLDANKIVSKVVDSVMETRNQGASTVSFNLVSSMMSNNAASSVKACYEEVTEPQFESIYSHPSSVPLSSIILEEVVVQFLANLFLYYSPVARNEETIPPISQVKRITEILLNALVIKLSENEILDRDEECDSGKLRLEDIQTIDNIVEIVYARLCKLFQQSHFSLLENLFEMLLKHEKCYAIKVADVILTEICNSPLQHLFIHGEVVSHFACIEPCYIAERVINAMQNMSCESQHLTSKGSGIAFLDKVVNKLLTKMLPKETVKNSQKANEELSKVTPKLMDAVFNDLSEIKNGVMRLNTERLHLNEEDAVTITVNSVYRNICRMFSCPVSVFQTLNFGSNKLCKQIASLITKEMYVCHYNPASYASASYNLYTDTVAAKIVKEALQDVTLQSTSTAGAKKIVNSVFHESADMSVLDELALRNKHKKADQAIVGDNFPVPTEPQKKEGNTGFSQACVKLTLDPGKYISSKTYATDISTTDASWTNGKEEHAPPIELGRSHDEAKKGSLRIRIPRMQMFLDTLHCGQLCLGPQPVNSEVSRRVRVIKGSSQRGGFNSGVQSVKYEVPMIHVQPVNCQDFPIVPMFNVPPLHGGFISGVPRVNSEVSQRGPMIHVQPVNSQDFPTVPMFNVPPLHGGFISGVPRVNSETFL